MPPPFIEMVMDIRKKKKLLHESKCSMKHNLESVKVKCFTFYWGFVWQIWPLIQFIDIMLKRSFSLWTAISSANRLDTIQRCSFFFNWSLFKRDSLSAYSRASRELLHVICLIYSLVFMRNQFIQKKALLLLLVIHSTLQLSMTVWQLIPTSGLQYWNFKSSLRLPLQGP